MEDIFCSNDFICKNENSNSDAGIDAIIFPNYLLDFNYTLRLNENNVSESEARNLIINRFSNLANSKRICTSTPSLNEKEINLVKVVTQEAFFEVDENNFNINLSKRSSICVNKYVILIEI